MIHTYIHSTYISSRDTGMKLKQYRVWCLKRNSGMLGPGPGVENMWVIQVVDWDSLPLAPCQFLSDKDNSHPPPADVPPGK